MTRRKTREPAQTWNTLPDNVKALAILLLTEKQLEAFQLSLAGMSERDIADALDIGRTTVQSRLEGAVRALRRAGCTTDGSDRWYLRVAGTGDAA